MNVRKVLLMVIIGGLLALGGVGIIAQDVLAARVTGIVDNFTSEQVTVEGLTIFTDNNTKIEGALAPGVLVKIKTTTRSDGSPLAVKIEAKDDSRAIKIEGTVDNITGNRISINGRIVFTDNHTLVKGTLAVGAVVEVKARLQDDGSLLAFKIEVEDESIEDDDDEASHGRYVKIEGATTNLTGTSLVVNGKTIKINDATKVQGNLSNGAAVKVKVITQSDGSLLAVKIKVANAQGPDNARGRANAKGRGDEEEDGED